MRNAGPAAPAGMIRADHANSGGGGSQGVGRRYCAPKRRWFDIWDERQHNRFGWSWSLSAECEFGNTMKPEQKVTIVAFGDSITEAVQQEPARRWPEILRRALQSRFASCEIVMINAGVGGNTSREGMQRLEKDVLARAPQFVLVEFGNDTTPEPARHVSVEEFAKNLDTFRAEVGKRFGGTTILLTFPPIVDQWHAWREHEFFLSNGGLDACQESYREAPRKLAATRGMVLCDIDAALRKEMAARGPGECILPDGVHLTARGNECVAETVLKALTPEIEKYLKPALVERVKRMAQRHAKKSGLALQPDPAQLRYVLEGLAENWLRHGKPYCPCREVTGNAEKDRANICPCRTHREEVERDGRCECGLYVRPELRKE